MTKNKISILLSLFLILTMTSCNTTFKSSDLNAKSSDLNAKSSDLNAKSSDFTNTDKNESTKANIKTEKTKLTEHESSSKLNNNEELNKILLNNELESYKISNFTLDIVIVDNKNNFLHSITKYNLKDNVMSSILSSDKKKLKEQYVSSGRYYLKDYETSQINTHDFQNSESKEYFQKALLKLKLNKNYITDDFTWNKEDTDYIISNKKALNVKKANLLTGFEIKDNENENYDVFIVSTLDEKFRLKNQEITLKDSKNQDVISTITVKYLDYETTKVNPVTKDLQNFEP